MHRADVTIYKNYVVPDHFNLEVKVEPDQEIITDEAGAS